MKVLVLLSTYNGERYLREQLDSILSQKGVEVSLIIRDDGSKDETCNVIDDYAIKNQNIRFEKSENIGFVRSFSSLIRAAQLYKEDVDFYAFADQDDIWMPDKLKIACKRLAKMDPNMPNLYTSNSIQITSEGEKISLFHPIRPRYRKGNVLIYSTEQGCSMVFNRKALEFYNLYPPQTSYHDRWMYMICFFLGSAYYDHEPQFYYRIHCHNAIGKISNREKKNILVRFFSKSMFKPLSTHLEMSREFYSYYSDYLNKKDAKLFLIYSRYRTNLINKMKMIFMDDFSCPYSKFKVRFYYFVCLLFNKL